MTQNNQPKKPAPGAKTPKKRKVALGKNIEWSDKALDAMSEINEADLLAADALWKQNAPKPLKGLLDAEVIEGDKKNGE